MTLPIPRFHGAYGLLAAALIPGIALAKDGRYACLLAGAILCGYVALGCLESGAVAPAARRHLAFWIALYGALAIGLFAAALPRLDLSGIVLPAGAGLALLLGRRFPPHPRLDRPIPREVLGMAALGLALPALLLASGVPLRKAAALYTAYAGFFGYRLSLVRGFLAGRAQHAPVVRHPKAAAAMALVLFAIALGLGLDPRTLVVLVLLLALGSLGFARDRRAERSVRAVGIEELAVALGFAIAVAVLGHRTTGT
jgi:hypothetical protein